METRSVSLWKTLDWVTIVIYLLLIIGGWFSVCGASYDYGDRDFLDFSTRAGKMAPATRQVPPVTAARMPGTTSS